MSAMFKILFLLTQATVILSVLPSIQKCPINDSQCIKKSAQSIVSIFVAGIPEMGIETLEPAHIELIDIDLAGLQLTLKHSDVTGLGKSIIDKLSFDTSKNILQFAFHVAPITLRGKYKAAGKLLILPISGDGDVTIKIKNLEVTMTMPYEIIKNENGKDFINIKSYTFKFENRENTHFKLTNLFGGNKLLSDTMHTFMNENWRLLSDQFGVPIVDKAVDKIYTAIKKYLGTQSLEDIVN